MSAQSRTTLWRTALVLGLALFLSYAYFYQAGGWNQNGRFALVRAILDDGTLRIDKYADCTGDRSLWEGHYYCDKAPGASFLALGPVELVRRVAGSFGVSPDSPWGVALGSYVAGLATSALFTVAAALAVFWLTVSWGASRPAAIFAASAYGLATPAWSYATVFVGHAVTSGCLMLAFAAAVALPDNPRRQTLLAWLVGLFCGLAVVTEFPAAPAVLIIVVFTLAHVHASNRSATLRVALHVVAAGALMAIVLLAYHKAAFGSPFQLGYGNEDNSEGAAMQKGLFGIAGPSWHVLYEVLLGAYRGLLPLAPLVAVAPLGLIGLSRTRGLWRPVLAAAAIAGYYLLLNVSYTYWEGGWFVGPRHLVPGLPFVALGLAFLWDWPQRVWRTVLVAGWLWGVALNLIVVSTNPQPPSNIMRPVQELLWPAFMEGDLSLNPQSFTDYAADPDRMRHNPAGHASWNLGERLGLHGLTSLLPLIAIWCLAALLLL
ncbi:MAG: hypothetical protein U0Q11_27245 [Vicinamibacterales bacterium]